MTSLNWQSIFYYPLVTVLQRINSDQIFVLSSFDSFTFFIRFTLNWMSSVDAWHLSYIWEGHTREGKCGPYRFVERIYCHVLPSFHSQSVSIFSILSPLRSFFVHTSLSGVFNLGQWLFHGFMKVTGSCFEQAYWLRFLSWDFLFLLLDKRKGPL